MGYIEDLRAMIGHTRINLCGSVVIIRNSKGHILMQQRKYPYGRWGLPGGLMELGEAAEDTARREVFEETGMELGNLKLLGVYSGKDYLCRAANGDEFYTVVMSYIADEYFGEPSVHDDESLQFRWFDPLELPENIAGSHRNMLRDYISQYVNADERQAI